MIDRTWLNRRGRSRPSSTCSGLLTLSAMVVATTVGVWGQATPPPAKPTQTPASATTQDQTPTVFKAAADHVSRDVKVFNTKRQFVPGLAKTDFRIFEDGVEQKIDDFYEIQGSQVLSSTASVVPAPAITEGLILPASRPPIDTSSRVFIIFIDDLHLQPADTILARDVLKTMRDTLLHQGDRIALVSTGYSGIESNGLIYDDHHVRLDDAIGRLMGSALTPEEIIEAPETGDGISGMRYRVDTAFRTAYDILDQLEQYNDIRKSFIYISSGYDLNPFQDSRLQYQQQLFDFMMTPQQQLDPNQPTSTQLNANNSVLTPSQAPLGSAQAMNPFAQQGSEFSEVDLIREVAELIRAANRANTVFYTVDPRGLVAAAPPGGTQLTVPEWNDYIRTSTTTLQVLAEQTGGKAAINTNDFKTFFKEVDDDSSDYYVIGYTSSNPDPTRRTRQIKITLDRPGLQVDYEQSYSIRPPGKVADKPKKTIDDKGGRGGGPPVSLPSRGPQLP